MPVAAVVQALSLARLEIESPPAEVHVSDVDDHLLPVAISKQVVCVVSELASEPQNVLAAVQTKPDAMSVQTCLEAANTGWLPAADVHEATLNVLVAL